MMKHSRCEHLFSQPMKSLLRTISTGQQSPPLQEALHPFESHVDPTSSKPTTKPLQYLTLSSFSSHFRKAWSASSRMKWSQRMERQS